MDYMGIKYTVFIFICDNNTSHLSWEIPIKNWGHASAWLLSAVAVENVDIPLILEWHMESQIIVSYQYLLIFTVCLILTSVFCACLC